MANKSKDTIWSVPFVILMMANFFQSMAAFMANTTLPLFANSLGVNTAMIGVIVSSFTVSALVIRPFAGPAFDSFSRKLLLMISQVIIVGAIFLYGIVDTVPALIAVRLLHGAGIGCGGPVAMSLVSEFLPPSKFASGISVYALAQSAAQVIGPATGIYVVDSLGFSVSYFLASASVAIALIGVAFIREPKRQRLPYEFKLSRMFARQAMPSALALMLLSAAFSCMSSYVVLYGYERGVEAMGAYFVVYALCLLVTRPVFGSLADRVGTPKVLLLGMTCFALSYFALSQARDFWGFMLAAVLGSAGFGCCGPLLQSRALASVSMEHRGAASNTAFTGLDCGVLLGPVIGGSVVSGLAPMLGSQAEAYGQMWLYMLVPVVLTVPLIIHWIRKDGQKSA